MPVAARKSPAEVFWSGVPSGKSILECWEWTRLRSKDGYGRVYINGKNILAHRLSLLISGKQLTSKDLACHTCDNKPCVNPYHLYVGTKRTNAFDAIMRGQASMPPRNDNSGEKHGMAKLDWNQVQEIRKLYLCGMSYEKLAKYFGITPANIAHIIKLRSWKKCQ